MGKLAIYGGKREVQKELFVPYPKITPANKRALNRVINRGIFWGLDSPEVKGLEKEWAEYIGTKYCLTTNSGTSAIHCAIHAVGIKPGDEIITTAYTFLASASAALHHNAIPIFVDIIPDTHQIDYNKIEERINNHTKAIIPVHIEGMPCDIDKILKIARKHNLFIIEDAAQAHGAYFKGKKVGNFGDISIFSLNGTKNLSGGEGGLFNTNNDDFKFRAEMLRTFGEVIEKDKPRSYNAFGMGWQYRNNELCAGFARSRLRTLDKENKRRQENVEYLKENLSDIKALEFQKVPKDRTHVYYLFRIKVDPSKIGLDIDAKEFRMKLQRALQAEGVQADEWQTMPVPGQKLFQLMEGYGYGYPWTDVHARKGIKYDLSEYKNTQNLLDTSFVMHSALCYPNGKKLLKHYVNAFYKCFENIDEILKVDTSIPLKPIHGRR